MTSHNENAPAAGTARGAGEYAAFDGLRAHFNTPSAEILPFDFETATSVRVVVLAGEPWFVGRDVAECLGYANPQKAIRDHCRTPRPLGQGVNESVTLTLDPQTVIIRQADMLRLIVKSQLPAAERFERWVFEEVLPAVLKTGRYAVTSTDPALPDFADPAAAARAWADQHDATTEAQAHTLALTHQVAHQAEVIEHQKPAVDFVARYTDSTGTRSIREVAKLLGAKETEFINWMTATGVVFRHHENGRLLPKAEHQHAGRFVLTTGSSGGKVWSQARFTSKGMVWIATRWAKRNGDGVGTGGEP